MRRCSRDEGWVGFPVDRAPKRLLSPREIAGGLRMDRSVEWPQIPQQGIHLQPGEKDGMCRQARPRTLPWGVSPGRGRQVTRKQENFQEGDSWWQAKDIRAQHMGLQEEPCTWHGAEWVLLSAQGKRLRHCPGQVQDRSASSPLCWLHTWAPHHPAPRA